MLLQPPQRLAVGAFDEEAGQRGDEAFGAGGLEPLELELDVGAAAGAVAEVVGAAGAALALGADAFLDDPLGRLGLDDLELGPVLGARGR